MAVFLGDYNIFGKREDMNVIRDKNGKYAAVIRKAEGDKCPIATRDVSVNLANREKAIETAAYGPLNPAEPNTDFWNAKAKRWELPIAEAKKSLCGNCAAFIKTPEMLECIEAGLGTQNPSSAMDTIKAGDLGYCEAFDFKCASARTCDAWISGGPVTKAKSLKVGDVVSYSLRKPEGTITATAQVERVETDGKVKIQGTGESKEATSADPVAVLRVYAETEAGLVETDRRILKPFSELRLTSKKLEKATEDTLADKVKEHNESVGNAASKRTTVGTLMNVYRRGIGAYNTNPSSVRPNVTGPQQWAMARVNGFLYGLKNGRFRNKPYDTDLLPESHPLHRKDDK